MALAIPFLFTSCVKDEIYGGSTISDISNTIAYTATDAVTVTAKVAALVKISGVDLIYTVNGGSQQTVQMSGSSDIYTGIIPAQAMDAVVEFFIKATTESMTTESAKVKYTVGAVPIDYSGLRLNELNGNDKFIEIYNNGADVPTLAGVYIEKDGKNLVEWSRG